MSGAKWPPPWFASAEGDGTPVGAHAKEMLRGGAGQQDAPVPESDWRVLRNAVLIIVAVVLAFVVVNLLLPGEPCSEWNGWRFIRIWPRPGHCPSPEMGE